MVALLLLSGAAEGVGLATLLPLLELTASGETRSRFAQTVSAMMAGIGLRTTLESLLGIIVLGMALKSAFQWLAMREVGYTVARVATDLRLTLMRALLEARWSYFVAQPSGHFANAISMEAYRASAAYREACAVLAGGIQAAVYLVLAFLLAWPVGLLAVGAGAVFLLGLRGFVQMSSRAGRRQTDRMMSLIAYLVDALQVLKPVKAMGREAQLWERLKQEADAFNEAQQRQVLATETMRALQQPLLVLMIALGLYALLTVGGLPFTAVLMMVFLFYRLMGLLHRVQGHYQMMAAGESAYWSLRSNVERAQAERETVGGTRKPPELTSGIELRAVSFSYNGQPALRDLTAFIPARRLVALVGPSGAGKTTIADVVIGLHRPDTGEVLLDGMPMANIDLAAWRRMIGYVPQDAPLFHDTIYNNIAMGDALTVDAVESALRDAGAWEFAAARPEGIHEIVGERGTMLSGGQRQRVALARALVRQPALLILDEATAGLDVETEAALFDTLRRLTERMTILFISHRPAALDAADVVIRLVPAG